MTVRSKQGDQEFRNEPSSEGSEESKDFGMARGEAFAEVGCQVRDLPIERPIVGFFDITVLFLGAWAHAFFEDVDNGIKSVVATRVTLEVVRNLVTDRRWSEEREDPKQRE